MQSSAMIVFNSKRRLAQKYFGVNDPDYYEWETHIFFDDAFKKGPPDAPDEKPVSYNYTTITSYGKLNVPYIFF